MKLTTLVWLLTCVAATSAGGLHEYLDKLASENHLMEVIKHSTLSRGSSLLSNRQVVFNFNKKFPFLIERFHDMNRLVMSFTKFVETQNFEEYGATSFEGVPLDHTLIARLSQYRIMEYIVIGNACHEMGHYFEMFALAKVENVVFACPQAKAFHFYTFKAYRKGNCSKINKIILLDVWNKATMLDRKPIHLPDRKIDLNGCRLKILLKLSPPAVMVSHKHGIHGWDISILDTVVDHLNGVPDFQIADIDRENPQVVKSSDIVGGMMKYVPRSSSEAIVCAGIKVKMVVVSPKLPTTYLSLFFDVFKGSLWVFILLICVLSVGVGAIMHCLEFNSYKAAFQKSLLGLPLLVDQPFSRRYPGRLSFCFWLLFTFMMTNIYRVGLSTKLTTQGDLNEIHDWKDSRLPFPIHCRQTICNWLAEMEQSCDAIHRLRPFDDGVPVFDVMASLARNRSFMLVELAETVVYSVRHMDRADLSAIQILDVPLYSFETAYSVHGSYSLQTSVATAVTRMAEAGVTTRIKDLLMGRAKRVFRDATMVNDKYRPVKFADVSSIFVIMIGLCGAATALFLFEWLWYLLSKKQSSRSY